MSYANGPKIVTDGLIYCLDAANRKSYPGSGSSCYDLSGNGNTGTLTNVDYSSSNQGTFVYDASTDVITVSMTNLRPTSQITQECWVAPSLNTAQVFIGAQYGSSTNNSYALWFPTSNQFAGGVHNGTSFNYQSQSITITINSWYHFIHTYDGSTQKLYMNGSEVRSWSTSGSITYDNNNTLLAVGNDWSSGYNGSGNAGTRGKLPVVRLYSKALSADEVRRNYNALKGRYGLT